MASAPRSTCAPVVATAPRWNVANTTPRTPLPWHTGPFGRHWPCWDWPRFDAVAKGEWIGQRADGTPVVAPSDGFVVFPNPSALAGNEWFYFAQRSGRSIAGGESEPGGRPAR